MPKNVRVTREVLPESTIVRDGGSKIVLKIWREDKNTEFVMVTDMDGKLHIVLVTDQVTVLDKRGVTP